jgi:Stress responsive A/B Barrel Domain
MKFLSILFFAICLLACSQPTKAPETNTTTTTTKTEATTKVLRHVVLFKFKEGLTAETVKSIEEAFKGLKTQIPSIQDFEWGLNNSPEKLDQGYTHCFMVTFLSEKDRDEYLPNPAHQAFVDKFAKLYVDKVCVFDYWTN